MSESKSGSAVSFNGMSSFIVCVSLAGVHVLKMLKKVFHLKILCCSRFLLAI